MNKQKLVVLHPRINLLHHRRLIEIQHGAAMATEDIEKRFVSAEKLLERIGKKNEEKSFRLIRRGGPDALVKLKIDITRRQKSHEEAFYEFFNYSNAPGNLQ
jgi:hypothetical protein